MAFTPTYYLPSTLSSPTLGVMGLAPLPQQFMSQVDDRQNDLLILVNETENRLLPTKYTINSWTYS